MAATSIGARYAIAEHPVVIGLQHLRSADDASANEIAVNAAPGPSDSFGISDEMRGRFITFEGGEGTGKSTHSILLSDRLEALGIDVVLTREPGGSPGAEAIRHVLLSGVAKPLGVEAEALLFAAARDDHVRTTIEPALARGAWVICDRFIDSPGCIRALWAIWTHC